MSGDSMSSAARKTKPLPMLPLVFLLLGAVAGMFAVIQVAFFPAVISIACFLVAGFSYSRASQPGSTLAGEGR